MSASQPGERFGQVRAMWNLFAYGARQEPRLMAATVTLAAVANVGAGFHRDRIAADLGLVRLGVP